MIRRRRAWLAALLSLALPGLGQLYAGHPAVGAYVATLAAAAFMLATWVLLPPGPVALLLGFIVGVTVYLAVCVHAGIMAAREPPHSS